MPDSPHFVAEISSNHHTDLSRCLRFVETAAQIGCDSVKFQLFRIDKLFTAQVLRTSPQHRQRRGWELPTEFLPELCSRAHELGLQFACTPFYLEAVETLYPFVDFYKIASYELLWDDLLLCCARTQKPVVLSCGMATLAEVRQAVGILQENNCRQLTLLHCVSGYPTPLEQCNLASIQTLRDTFQCPTGWSDHSVSAAVLRRAIHRWQASLVEFHLDLDGCGEEYETGHCWLPPQIQPLIRETRLAMQADGSGRKEPAPAEAAERGWRADPSDGLRPLIETRQKWKVNSCAQSQ